MKKAMRDILPKQNGKSIRNVSLPEKESSKKIDPPEIPVRKIWMPSGDEKPRNKSNKGIWFTAIIALLVLFFGASALFGSVSVIITPKKATASISSTINAVKDPQSGQIGYVTVTLSDNNSVFLAGSGTQQVSTKATGQVVLYNNTSSVQKLVQSTRLVTGSSTIFHIDSTVSIPARKGTGSSTTPGSIAVGVTADQPGSSYNVGLADFNVVAFKGDPKYDQVYGRSKSAVSGGQSGPVASVDPALLSQSTSQLEQTLSTELMAKIVKQIPQKFIVPENAFDFSLSTSTPVYTQDGATVSATGTITAYAIDAGSLFQSIQNKNIADAVGTSNVTVGTSTLSASSFNETASGLSMALTGDFTVEALVTADDVFHAIENLSKNNAISALRQFPGVDEAQISFSPIWKFKVPDNSDKVMVTIQK